MKIHAMCMVKNEADVIEECLRAAAQWADHIYVFDNGSTDGTWEIVQRLWGEFRQLHPWKSQEKPFSDGLRWEIFTQFKHLAQPGDWWARLDADEFYVTDPRAFLAAVPKVYNVVWYAPLSYYFSTQAAEEYERNPDAFMDSVPVAQKCRYYVNHWSEPRFVRHEAMISTPWSQDSSYGWPPRVEMKGSCPVRILCKHYAYRSPAQIERRISTRLQTPESRKVFSHETFRNWSQVVDPRAVAQHKWQDMAYCTDAELREQGWRSRVIDAAGLHYDAHDGRYVINETRMPALPGEYRSISDDTAKLARRILGGVKRKVMRAAG